MIRIVQDMNTVIEESQNSPAADGLAVIIIIVVVLLIPVLFRKGK